MPDPDVTIACNPPIEFPPRWRPGAEVLAVYASTDPEPRLPFWPMLSNNTTIRLLGSDDFPRPTSQQSARDIVACLEEGRLQVGIGARFPLDEIAAAHEAVDRPSKPGRVLLLLD